MRSFRKISCDQKDCPRWSKQHFIPCEVVQDGEDGQVNILFIGEQPSHEDIQSGTPFAGQQGSMMRRLGEFSAGDAAKSGIAYSYLVRCQDGDKPEQNVIDRCRKFVELDIERLDPKLIVIQGATALAALIPGANNIAQERGVLHEIVVKGKKYKALVTWRPGFVMMNPSTLPLFQQDIALAFQLSQGFEYNTDWQKKGTYSILKTVSEVKDYVNNLLYEVPEDTLVGFDVETRNLMKRPAANKLGLLQFATDTKHGVCIPYEHPLTPFSPEELETVRQHLYRLFTEKPKFQAWVVHGGVFEQIMVRGKITQGKTIRNAKWFDTEGMMYLLDENRSTMGKQLHSIYGLKRLARELLLFNGYDQSVLEAREGKGESTSTGKTVQGILGRVKLIEESGQEEEALDSKLLDLPLDQLCDYGAMDAYVTLRLYWYMVDRASRDKYRKKLLSLSNNLFGRAYRLFATMSMNGFYVDLKHLRLLGSKQSPIIQRMKELNDEMKSFDTVKKANDLIEKQSSGGQKALFGKPWVYSIDKKTHNAVTLYQVMKLVPPEEDLPQEYEKQFKSRSDESWVERAWAQAIEDGHVPPVNRAVYDAYIEYDEVAKMKEYAEMKKLATAYVNQIDNFINPDYKYPDCVDYRIRPDFKFTKTVTGRTSSQGPNMQQIPRAENTAKSEIKNMFKAQQVNWFDSWLAPAPVKAKHKHRASENTALVQLDFMANEVRWWCIISQDPILAKAFNEGQAHRRNYANLSKTVDCSWKELSIGKKIFSIFDSAVELDKAYAEYGKKVKDVEKLAKYKKNLDVVVDRLKSDTSFHKLCEAGELAEIAGDIHKLTASLMFQVPIKQVKKEMRQATKNIVFGWMFGRSTASIAVQLKNPDINAVQALCDKFGGQFQKAASWLTEIEEFGAKHAYVESLIGRRRRLAAFLTNNKGMINEAKRQARNSPIQGIASDAAIIGASLFSDYIEDNELPWLMQNAVHDSGVTQTPVNDIEECVRVANDIFTTKTMEFMTDTWGIKFNAPVEVEFEISQAPKHAWGELSKWDFSVQNMRALVAGAMNPNLSLI